MTVNGLLNQLKTLPPEMEVRILMNDDFYGVSAIQICSPDFEGKEPPVCALLSDEDEP